MSINMENEKMDVMVDLEPDTIIYLALEAHKLDITLNEYCNKVLRAFHVTTEGKLDGEDNS